jgi:dihydroxyacetone kinase-like protein
MSMLTVDTFKAMTAAALTAVVEQADRFSALDAVTGDGDHGTAIVTALTAVDRVARDGSNLKAMLGDMGFAAMSEACGSTSTLIGALLLGMSDGVEADALDAPATAAMFAAGLASVQKQTKASVGDKTMMDALIPAVEAMQAHQDAGMAAMLQAAAIAAAEGAEKTTDMIARFGRARNLGERVVGHADAGATSMACIFDAFARGFESLTA